MPTATLNFFTDPGHGWLEVGVHELRDVGLNPYDFSPCSYRQRNRFFLEEDCDAPKFLAAYKAKYGGEPVFNEVHTDSDSFIRDCARIA
jgi:hypothetical protein